uniref:lysylphosphatidylglycerol synthase transmembrane domain-containing protein n=1 Tax=Streptomyces sp. FR1 TaxID=349971 RepID=UPI0021AC2381|nr:lysylphosphatidylglycerol synthase transmembrane domain-containing protein [Streptomyces sp. FR1]
MPAAARARPTTRPSRAWWLVAAVLATAVILLAIDHRHELAAATRLLARVSPPKLALATAFEAASLVCFAGVQRWLLHAGGTRLSLKTMTALTVAANALAGALPGGAAFSAAWLFRQLRRRRVGQVLAAAVLVVAGTLSALSLFVLLVAGALTAGLGGPGGAVLRPALGVAGLALGVGLVALALFRLPGFRAAAGRAWTRAGERYRRVRQIEDALVRLVAQARSVQPGLRPWLRPFGLALLNWAFDIACLAAALWALGIGIPWRGLLLAYALTQIPGSLRLTPGSIGIVEASLATLLTVYGLRPDQAIAATLLYRIVGYWVLQPIGWATWIGLTFRARRPAPDRTGGPDQDPDIPH